MKISTSTHSQPIWRALAPAGNFSSPREVIRTFLKLETSTDVEIELSRQLIDFFHADNVILGPHGKSALTQLLIAYRNLTGASIACVSAYTCPDVAAAVVRAGYQIYPLDLEPDSLQTNWSEIPSSLEFAVCIVSNLFGFPERLSSAVPEQWFVIDDACQATGSYDELGRVGMRTGVGITSFSRGKSLSSLGGGAILLNKKTPWSDAILRELKAFMAERWSFSDAVKTCLLPLLEHPFLYGALRRVPGLGLGQVTCDLEFSHTPPSSVALTNALSQLEKISETIAARVHKAERWSELLAHSDHVVTFQQRPQAVWDATRYPILLQDFTQRDRAVSALANFGATSSYSHTLQHFKPLQSKFAVNPGDCRNAQMTAKRLITLPTHRYVREQDMIEVRHILQDVST